MVSYKEGKAVYDDAQKDKWGKWIARGIIFVILCGLILSTCQMMTDRKSGRPYSYLWGAYQSTKIDTIVVYKHDTLFKYIPTTTSKSNPKQTNKITQNADHGVISIDQKGGQTANEIRNNY